MNTTLMFLLLSTATPDPLIGARVLSAQPIPAGEGVIALGLSLYAPVPTLAIRYLHGLADGIALDLAIDTIGVAQAARAGARISVLETSKTAVSLRVSAIEAHDLIGHNPDLLVGAGPGMLVSFGTPKLLWTVSVDGALGVANRPEGTTTQVELRPALGIELPIDETLGFLAEASTVVLIGGDQTVALPVLTAAIAW